MRQYCDRMPLADKFLLLLEEGNPPGTQVYSYATNDKQLLRVSLLPMSTAKDEHVFD